MYINVINILIFFILTLFFLSVSMIIYHDGQFGFMKNNPNKTNTKVFKLEET
jgi:hypothetical protein